MISFDIFDTLITRTTFSPYGIFLLIQKKLQYSSDFEQYKFLIDNFCALRMNAEKDARLYVSNKGIEDVSLQEIYNLMSCRMTVPKELLDYIMQEEIRTEMENSVPIWSGIKLLKDFLNAGNKIVLISDMYLDKKIIRGMLVKYDSVFEEIPIYVSGEFGKTKKSGGLYFEVARREKEEFSDWIHYGDNEQSDYLIPKMLGICAERVQREGLISWEKDLGSRLNLKSSLTAQIYFGIARNIRLEEQLNLPKKVGASIGGMLLYPYVSWILNRSLEQNICRLYFIARDGYILKKIADIIIQNRKLDIHTFYIYGSRKAWRTEGQSQREKKVLLKYLEQEVDFSDERFAFVDLHGTGFTMRCLSDIILKKFEIKIKVFYFDLDSEELNDAPFFISYCSEHSAMIELFGRAPHGATLGYKVEGKKIVPKMMPVNITIWKNSGLYDYIEGVELFAGRISKYIADNSICGEIDLVETILEYCRNNPSKELLEFLGEIPHGNGEQEDKIKYAPILSIYDVFRLYMWRTIEDVSELYPGTNPTLSFIRTGNRYDTIKAFFEKNYETLLGKCIHRYKARRNSCNKHKKKRVVIYAAGDLGRRLHQHLLTASDYQIVAWTDMNFDYYKKQGYPVVELVDALKQEYDYIVIAVNNKNSCREIRGILTELGVQNEKIVNHKDFLKKYR